MELKIESYTPSVEYGSSRLALSRLFLPGLFVSCDAKHGFEIVLKIPLSV